MRKKNASSDNKKNSGEGFLPAERLWRAAQMFCQYSDNVLVVDAEPTPEEILGLTIGIWRRRKNISRLEFAHSIGCSVEELLAFEAGLLSKNQMQKYLPTMAQEIGLDPGTLQPLKRRVRIA